MVARAAVAGDSEAGGAASRARHNVRTKSNYRADELGRQCRFCRASREYWFGIPAGSCCYGQVLNSSSIDCGVWIISISYIEMTPSNSEHCDVSRPSRGNDLAWEMRRDVLSRPATSQGDRQWSRIPAESRRAQRIVE